MLKHAVLSCVWGWVLISAGAEQFVGVTAKIETVRWLDQCNAKPPRVETRQWTAQCIVGTNSWLIEQYCGGITRDAWWYNGSNITAHTVVLRYPSDRVELFERNHPGIVVGHGYSKSRESHDGGPMRERALLVGDLGETDPINISWLAFCSGTYLQQNDRQIPLPNFGQWSLGLEWNDKTTTFEDRLGLPTSSELYATNNQPVCQYRTLGVTNVLGWNFPLRFYLASYRRSFASRTWELDLTASGVVTGIGPASEPQLPTPAQKALER